MMFSLCLLCLLCLLYDLFMPLTHTDRVREYARREYIDPARSRRQSTVRIVAGEVQKAVRLTNRVPLVCQALKSTKFLTENHLILEKVEGPPSGMSTTVTFTYRILDDGGRQNATEPEGDPFRRLRGVAKEVFRSLGGGEAFLRGEREQFHGSGEPS
jgi:hypothetical protein